MQWVQFMIPSVVIILAGSLVFAVQALWRLRHAHQALVSELGIVKEDVAVLGAGAAGTSEHVTRLGQRLRCFVEKQQTMESAHDLERPYGRAIQLVHNGAGIDELVETCRLTRSEAELIVMLHRVEMAV